MILAPSGTFLRHNIVEVLRVSKRSISFCISSSNYDSLVSSESIGSLKATENERRWPFIIIVF